MASDLFLLIAQAATPAASAAPRIESAWDFVVKGGPTMMFIVLCSLVTLAVVVERFIVLQRRRIAPPDLLTRLEALSGDRVRSLELCRTDGSPLANILAAAIDVRGERPEIVEKAIEGAGRRELVRLRARMRLLGALPQVATMLGLLGTIFGMIKTFQAVATSADAIGKTELLARGIFEAWTNTAGGLIVAIPTIVAYHTLMSRMDGIVAMLDRAVTDWMTSERTRLRGHGGVSMAPRTELESAVAPPARNDGVLAAAN